MFFLWATSLFVLPKNFLLVNFLVVWKDVNEIMTINGNAVHKGEEKRTKN